MRKRQLPYIHLCTYIYTVCILSKSILYFGALHVGKQASTEQLQWHKWCLFPLWGRYSYFVGLVCVNCANG